jgi:hypothetical protein
MAKDKAGIMKKVCPINRKHFTDLAKALPVVIDGNAMHASVHQFSTGSFGWYLNAKVNVKIGDEIVPVQIGGNFTVVGSKEAK